MKQTSKAPEPLDGAPPSEAPSDGKPRADRDPAGSTYGLVGPSAAGQHDEVLTPEQQVERVNELLRRSTHKEP